MNSDVITQAETPIVEAPAISPAMQKQVARALEVCAKVARLTRRYGSDTRFIPWKSSGSAKTAMPVKSPRRKPRTKGTIKGLR